MQTLRNSRSMIALIAAISATLIGIVLLLHLEQGIPIDTLTRDPNSVGGVPVYAGFISQLGILCWAAAATICLFSARILSRWATVLQLKQFLWASGALTLLLGLDDAFQLHEELFPLLGLSEIVVFSSYIGLLLLYLGKFYRVILETECVLFAIALIFLGSSIALDVLLEPLGLHSYLLEDGTKLVGIISWLVYFARVGAYALYCHTHVLNDRQDPFLG